MPVGADTIRQATQRDPILSPVDEYTKQGWPPSSEKELEPFHKKNIELTLQDSYLMWGSRVIIPPKYQAQLLGELHEGHLGIVKNEGHSQELHVVAGNGQGNRRSSKRVHRMSTHPEQS